MAQPAVSKARAARKPLTGPEKVAALLLAMGKPLSARLLPHFDPAELRELTRSAAELGPIAAPELESLIEEFAGQFSGGRNLIGTAREVEKLLSGILPAEQIAEMMTEGLGSSNSSIWERVSSVSDSVFANYLLKEHPQTIALILSKVRPACAAKVMGQLPPKLRHEMMRRMLTAKPVMEAAMRMVETTLHEDLLLNFARNTGADTHTRIANIINKMDRDHMEDVLQSLSEVRPKSAEVLKGLLFTFDDIVNLAPKARAALFDQVATERVVLALKGTDETFRNLILSSLASRARRIVESELANGEPASQRDVLEARRLIADLALEMAGRGEIELSASEEEETFS